MKKGTIILGDIVSNNAPLICSGDIKTANRLETRNEAGGCFVEFTFDSLEEVPNVHTSYIDKSTVLPDAVFVYPILIREITTNYCKLYLQETKGVTQDATLQITLV